MGDLAVFLKVLPIWLLWKLARSEACTDQPYQIPGHVLVNHMIQSFQGISSADSCLSKCSDNSSCHSINWYSTGFCQINNGNHLSYPQGIVTNLTGIYMQYSVRPIHICSNKYCSDTGLTCVVERAGDNYQCLDCNASLGMQDGRIKDSQLSASSEYRETLGTTRARLHSTVPDGSWTARNNMVGEYFQIDLLTLHIISKVASQGRSKSEYNQWVTRYYLKFSFTGANWQSYKHGGIVKEFSANMDPNSVVTNTLPKLLTTRLIRIVAISWNANISMRLEIYGCLIP